MHSKYISLLSAKYRSVSVSDKVCDKYLWNFIYQNILRAAYKGDTSTMITGEMMPEARDILVKQGYIVITNEKAKSSIIDWKSL